MSVQVLSPLGEVFPNKGRAIAHMVSNGFPEEQVSNISYRQELLVLWSVDFVALCFIGEDDASLTF